MVQEEDRFHGLSPSAVREESVSPPPPSGTRQFALDEPNAGGSEPNLSEKPSIQKLDIEKTDRSEADNMAGILRPQGSESSIEKPLVKQDLELGNAGGFQHNKVDDEVEKAQVDPNIVDFDGPEDPTMALNWPASRKWGIVATLSAMTFITPLASSMFAPAVPELLVEFQVSGIVLSSFVVSVYILGFAAGPLVIAPLSELYGRSILYHSFNFLFLIWTIACALATDMNMLIGFRLMEGICGSAVLTMGAGTLADLFVQEERGKAMALWASGPMLGPIIGPLGGAFLAQAKGWRWTFWVIAMACGVIGITMAIVLDETYAPVILEWKAKRLRKETGNPNLRSKLASKYGPSESFWHAIVRPTKMLFLSPIVLLLSIYNAVIYGYLYILFTTITELFESVYGFGQGVVGLTFLGVGIGMFIGLIIFGGLSDKLLSKYAGTGEKKPEYRLPPAIIAGLFVPMGLFVYGWTAEYQVFWIWPILGTGILGLGILGIFMCIQTYLVDAYTIHAASAVAANTILRSLAGALLPLAGPPLYKSLGLGWGNSVLGFIAVAMTPVPWLFAKYGERIRKNPRFQPNL